MAQPVYIKQPYVYMDFLQETNPDIWNQAVNVVNDFNAQTSSFTSSERMQNAIEFLRIVAEKQRIGEMAFVKNKIQELKKEKSVSTKKIKRYEKRLAELITNIEKGIGFDYEEFTSILNEISISEEAMQGRIRALMKNLKSQEEGGKKTQGVLENVGKEIKNVITALKTENQNIKKTKRSYIDIMPRVLRDYMEQHKTELSGLTTKELTAWIIRTTVKFRQYIETNNNGKFLTDFTKTKQYDARKTALENTFESFIKVSNPFNIDKKDKELLDEIAISFFQPNISEEEKLKKKYQIIENPFSDLAVPEIIFNFDLLDYSISEKVSQLLYRMGPNFKASGASNMADDALIGSLSASINMEYFDELNKSIDNTLLLLDKATKDFSDVRKNRAEYSNNLKKLNNEIENILTDLNTQLKVKKETGFVIHESDKYYQSIEHGMRGSRPGEFGFHGRTMAIMNYIDTMASISADFGIGEQDRDLWKFIGINLSKHTVAESCKSSMEEIFTIAAGIIMFDDFATIVKEGMGQLDFSNLHNIHLYKLQSLYFPASYIIQETANFLEFGLAENPAKAVISVPINIFEIERYEDLRKLYNKRGKTWKEKAQGQIDKYNAENSTIEQWNMVKNYMATETKVSINFFLNFQNFINKIPH